MNKYEHLRVACDTIRQHEVLDALLKADRVADAAKALAIDERDIYEHLQRIKKKFAERDGSPCVAPDGRTPPGYIIKGKSEMARNAAGDPVWVKSERDKALERIDYLRDAMLDVASAAGGRAKARKRPAQCSDNLMTAYCIGDPHVGLYCWKGEVGEDFDVKIARQELIATTSELTRSTPKTKHGLILNLGDYFHADNALQETMRSHHKLDVDSRWPHVLRVGLQLSVDLIEMARDHHEQVTVINCVGNHDDHSSVFLAEYQKAWFRDVPEVTIMDATPMFSYFRFGKVFIGATHGHLTKMQDLPGIMAHDRPADWAETMYRYWYVGHVHHSSKTHARKEHFGVPVESFRTLAPRDFYAHSHGYRSGRDMSAIVHDAEYGEVARFTCDVRRARAA